MRKKFFNKFDISKKEPSSLWFLDGNDFMDSFNEKLGIMFTTPEIKIIEQDEMADDMFFILKGDCIVDMLDYENKMHETMRILVVSDYFGEIALLHQCPRTCTVISRNYNTLARLTYDRFRMLLHEFPSLKSSMLKKVYGYCDPNIDFTMRIIKNIEYLQSLSQESIHHLVSKMDQQFYLKDDIVLREGSSLDGFLIVANGCVEIFSTFEG